MDLSIVFWVFARGVETYRYAHKYSPGMPDSSNLSVGSAISNSRSIPSLPNRRFPAAPNRNSRTIQLPTRIRICLRGFFELIRIRINIPKRFAIIPPRLNMTKKGIKARRQIMISLLLKDLFLDDL